MRKRGVGGGSFGSKHSIVDKHLFGLSHHYYHPHLFFLPHCPLPSAPKVKSIKTIQDEIRSVIRQITATVTFLPLLESACENPFWLTV